ncbi:acyltransferase [Mucilaginibacter ximonensis]|uniref:Acyltransferase n=1 Tax=Mucilaginibacter ximonensis TaxID=538021 RepID=A0ABW5YEY2_9SPHI
MIRDILIFGIRLFKKLIFKLSDLENSALCEKLTTNNGGVFLSQASITNLQNDKKKIIIGKGSHIRGQLLIYPYDGKITIGDYCYIGEGSRLWSGESITIGNNVLISHNVNIMDTNAHEIDSVERALSYRDMTLNGHPLNKGSVQTASIVIGNDVWINFNVSILKGVTIGQGAIIAAGSVVTHNIPPYVLAAGVPAKVLKNLNINDK